MAHEGVSWLATSPLGWAWHQTEDWLGAYTPERAQALWQSYAPLYERAWERIKPEIQAAFAGPGFYSRARGEVLARARQDLDLQRALAEQQLLYAEELMRREALARRAQLAAFLASLQAQQDWYERMMEEFA